MSQDGTPDGYPAMHRAFDVAVMAIIRRGQSETRVEIVVEADHAYSMTENETNATLNRLVKSGMVRQKDDDQEHDWVYRLNQSGRDEPESNDAQN